MGRVAGNDRCGGLEWHFLHTRESARFTFPTTRVAIVTSVCRFSTKYSYVLYKALTAKEKGEKLLLYCTHPLTSLYVLTPFPIQSEMNTPAAN